jgi:hypothetical protein
MNRTKNIIYLEAKRIQESDFVPKELLVQIEGVSSLIRPKVEYPDTEARMLPILARQDGFEQLYSNDVITVRNALVKGQTDTYSLLSQKQPLVQQKKLSKDKMTDILSRFADEVLHKYKIWVELLDWQPEKRMKDYEMQKDANAVLYRNWNLLRNKVYITNAITIPIKWMERSGNVSEEIVKAFNAPSDTYVWSNRQYSIEDYDGLVAISWDFMGRPRLGSCWDPKEWGSTGAIVRNKLSIEEMVKNFK